MINENPKISCYCATYDRPLILEESIYSFLNQNYQNKELIIVNDCKEQNLIFEHPQVKIYNFKDRIDKIGTKFNIAAQMCTGEILMPWDDDDIYLPWKMEVSLKLLKNGIFHTNQAFIETKPKELSFTKNLFHCNLAVEKTIFEDIGGYEEENRATIDTDLFAKLRSKHGNFSFEIPNQDLFYIYRWSTVDCLHLSTIAPKADENIQTITEKIHKSKKTFQTGDIKLNPKWRYDYVKISQEFLKNQTS